MGFLKNLAKTILPEEVGGIIDTVSDIVGDVASDVTSDTAKKAAFTGAAAIAGGLGLGKLLSKGEGANKEQNDNSENSVKSVEVPKTKAAQPAATPAPFSDQVVSTTKPAPTIAPPPVESVKFFALIDGRQEGPYDQVQFARLLQYGLANAGTMVWKQGMDGWKKACEVEEMSLFFPKAPTMPPPPPTTVSPAMPPFPPTSPTE